MVTSRSAKGALALLVLLSGSLCAGLFAAQAKPAPPPTATPSPKPVLTSVPAAITREQSATFSFSSARNGVSFQCRRDGADFTECSSPKTYTGPLAQGTHTFAVRTVGAGGQSAAATYTWRIDVTRPASPALTSTPERPTTSRTATFEFTSTHRQVSFRCDLDGRGFVPCTSAVTYTQLRTGSHTFAVRAIDPAGNRSGTTRFSWTILTAVHAFSITAAPAGGLYPGAVVPVDLDITNPYNFAIVVSGLTVEPEDATTRDGLPNPACSGTTNLVTSRQYSGPALVIPKKATRSLSDLAVPESQWPQLEMPNLPTNQDACKATTFTFGSSGTATRGTP